MRGKIFVYAESVFCAVFIKIPAGKSKITVVVSNRIISEKFAVFWQIECLQISAVFFRTVREISSVCMECNQPAGFLFLPPGIKDHVSRCQEIIRKINAFSSAIRLFEPPTENRIFICRINCRNFGKSSSVRHLDFFAVCCLVVKIAAVWIESKHDSLCPNRIQGNIPVNDILGNIADWFPSSAFAPHTGPD